MAYASSITPISLDDKVRFKEERLSVLAPADRKRLEGRVGVVQSYWNFTRKLTVYFPQDSGRPELRILSVDPRQLERLADDVVAEDVVAENVIEAGIEPVMSHVSGGDESLSQEDMDKLFG